MRVKWNVHLDLSTDSTQYRAYIYSHPTVVDLDRDGYMEILVGTSEGFLYCLSHVGELSNRFSNSGDHILFNSSYDSCVCFDLPSFSSFSVAAMWKCLVRSVTLQGLLQHYRPLSGLGCSLENLGPAGDSPQYVILQTISMIGSL
jgi:hypothetical protein